MMVRKTRRGEGVMEGRMRVRMGVVVMVVGGD